MTKVIGFLAPFCFALVFFFFFFGHFVFSFFSVLKMFPTISLDFVVNYYKLMFVLIADCKLRQQESKTSRELTFSG